MKKVSVILCMFVCFVLMDKAHAQRCLPGMQGLRITGGMVDGFHSAAHRNQLGYHFGLSLDTYTKHCNRWVFGAEYLQKYHPYKDIRIPTSQFTAEGGYYYTFLSDANKTFLLSIGGSALAGYETNNWGKKPLFDGSTLQSDDAFLYGGALSLELESYLSNRVVLLLNARERCLWGTQTGRFHFEFGAGIKFLID